MYYHLLKIIYLHIFIWIFIIKILIITSFNERSEIELYNMKFHMKFELYLSLI